MAKLRNVKLGHVMNLTYTLLNRPTTGTVYQTEEGIHLEFERILEGDKTELAYYHLSSEDTIDGEDLVNINEILELNHLSFNNYMKAV